MKAEPVDHAEAGKGAGDIASFVLRFTQDLWRDEAGDPRLRWRGHVRHVQSDAEARFTDFADAVAFMQRRLAELTLAAVAEESEPDQARVMAESLRLWQRFANDYADMMVASLRRSAQQTEAYQRQVGASIERTMQLWNPLAMAAGFGAAGAAASGAAAPTGGNPASGSEPEPPAAIELLEALRGLNEVLRAMQASLEAIDRRVESLQARIEARGGEL